VNEPEEPASVRRFTGLAEIYDRFRPGYPQVAIAALLAGLSEHPTIVDIGAGTGIASRALVQTGAHVIAIEPNDDMRAFAVASGIDARAGTAAATGLPDRCTDLVASFQAFHWFANVESLAEFRRILRPRGRIALVWNERDMRDPFTRDFRDVEKAFGEDSMLASIDFDDSRVDPLLTGAGFEAISWQRFDNAQTVDRDAFVGRVRSTSYAPRSGPALDALIASLHELHTRYADAAGNVTLLYQTEVILATLASG
jgi:SAM-dependent methyltransferase